MKGSYCLVLELPEDTKVRVGAKGMRHFRRGVYAYVGSAQSGLEQRVGRHLRTEKKRRWHIDYLLNKADVVSTIMIPGGLKTTECEIARALLSSAGAEVAMDGFGSSDCDCPTHLVYFGPEDPEWVSEEVARTIALLPCIYPERAGSERE